MTDPTGRPTGRVPAAVWLAIPDGYASLPLHDIPETLDATGQLIDELGTATQRATGAVALGTLATLLAGLAERNAVYCGVGRHLSALDGRLVTSSLVVTLLEFPHRRNPRLVLTGLLESKKDAGEIGQADLVELPNGPALFFERTRTLPTPPAPGRDAIAASAESPVWQLEVFVPSAEGDRLATIEVSTPFVGEGPQYRGMLVGLAAGVAFRPPQNDMVTALRG